MKRKLMLISPMLHQGGFERVCITTARLLESHFDITIVIFNSDNIAYDISGLDIVDIRVPARKGKVRKIFNILKRSVKVRRLKKQMKPDIVYSFGPTANLVNAFSRTGREQVWLGLRNYTDVEETLKIKVFTRFADLMVCCSRVIEQDINSKFNFEKTAVLYNLYDMESIRKEACAGDPELPWGEYENGKKIRTMISMGRDDDMKGFWHMLKVFALVHEKIPESRLILLGAGTFDHYRELAEKLGIADVICFAGMQRKPYQYLKKAEIYLLTSLNEGFPNALVEAMCLGLAPVCTDCMTGPAEILLDEKEDMSFGKWKREGGRSVIHGRYGILVPVMSRERDLNPDHISEEEKNMADVVAGLLMDEERLKEYQQAAAGRAGIFTYESYRDGFLKLANARNEERKE